MKDELFPQETKIILSPFNTFNTLNTQYFKLSTETEIDSKLKEY